MAKFEQMLPLSPNGDAWKFSAPARCSHCHAEIAGAITKEIYYVLFPDAVNLTGPDRELWLEFYGARAS